MYIFQNQLSSCAPAPMSMDKRIEEGHSSCEGAHVDAAPESQPLESTLVKWVCAPPSIPSVELLTLRSTTRSAGSCTAARTWVSGHWCSRARSTCSRVAAKGPFLLLYEQCSPGLGVGCIRLYSGLYVAIVFRRARPKKHGLGPNRY
jgi:hypothetical protein